MIAQLSVAVVQLLIMIAIVCFYAHFGGILIDFGRILTDFRRQEMHIIEKCCN